MKLGKKLLGIVSTAAILTTSLTLPGFFAGAAGKTEADFNNLVLSNDFETDGKGFTGLSDSFRVANENTYFVSTGKNDSLTLDLAAQKNYYLTFKLKFDFGGNQGWEGPMVTVRDGIAAKISYGFIGNEGAAWNGAWTEEARKWVNEWLDIGMIVYENTLTITVTGDCVAGGTQVFTSALEDNGKACPITISGANTDFAVDDIRVRNILTCALNAPDEEHNWRTWIDQEALGDNYRLDFLTKVSYPPESDQGWHGLAVLLGKTAQGNIFSAELKKTYTGLSLSDAEDVNHINWSKGFDTADWTPVGITLNGGLAELQVGGDQYRISKEQLGPASLTRTDVEFAASSCSFETAAFVATPVADLYVNGFENAGDAERVTTSGAESKADNKVLLWSGLGDSRVSTAASHENFVLEFKTRILSDDPERSGSGGTAQILFGGFNFWFNTGWKSCLSDEGNQYALSGGATVDGPAMGAQLSTVRIAVIGETVTIYLNGSKIMEKDGLTPAEKPIVFAGWNCSYLIDDVKLYGLPFTVTAVSDNEAMGTVTGGGEFTTADQVTVRAVAKEGYRFVNWVDAAGTEVSTEAAYTFAPIADITLKAVFTGEAAYAVTVKADPETRGTVTGGGNVIRGQSVTVKAAAKEGSEFVSWVDAAGNEVSTEAAYTFTPTADIALTAKFRKLPFTEVEADFEDDADLNLFDDGKNLLSIAADPQNASNKVLKFHATGSNWGAAATKAANYDNFVMTVKVLLSSECSGSGNFSLGARRPAEGDEGALAAELSDWKCKFGVLKDGQNTSEYLDFALQKDKWTVVKLVVDGNQAALYFDGVLKAKYEGEVLMNETGAIALSSWTDDNIVAYLDDLRIVNEEKDDDKEPEEHKFTEIFDDFEGSDAGKAFDMDSPLLSIAADPQNASNKVLKFHAAADNWGVVKTLANDYDDFVLTAKILWSSETSGSGNFSFGARRPAASDEGSLSAELSDWKCKLGVLKDGQNTSDYLDFAMQADKWTQLKLVVKGNKAELYLDGARKATYEGETLMNEVGYISLSSWTDGNVVVYLDDLRIAHADSTSPGTGESSVLPFGLAALCLSGAALLLFRRRRGVRG